MIRKRDDALALAGACAGASMMFVFMMTTNVFAQGRPPSALRDFASMWDGVKFFIILACQLAALGILAYHTFKWKFKDTYEAAWTAIGWCLLAYMLR